MHLKTDKLFIRTISLRSVFNIVKEKNQLEMRLLGYMIIFFINKQKDFRLLDKKNYKKLVKSKVNKYLIYKLCLQFQT